ncbi:MAG: hypothetical protein OWU32_04140 [Firmicutes bacterium]|nr:hypothetical protein [Bacillota bacterium]
MKKTFIAVSALIAMTLGSSAVAFAQASTPQPAAVSTPALHMEPLSAPPGASNQNENTTPKIMAIASPNLVALSIASMGNPQPAPASSSQANSASSSEVQPEARGSVGPFNPPPVSSGYMYPLTTVTTVAGGISVGGYFANGGYIVCQNTSNGNEYVGGVHSGSTSALTDYIAAPSGTYEVFIANPTNTSETYSNLTVFYN